MIDPKELLLAVDANNRPVEPIERGTAHKKGIWHRSIDVWVIDGDPVLCQKRSQFKDTCPGMWEPCFGGHLGPGDTYLGCAQKELQEELGVLLPENKFRHAIAFKYINDDKVTGAIDREFLEIFLVNWSGDTARLKLEEAEVEKIEWRSFDELSELIGKDDQWVFVGYELKLLKKLRSQNRGEL